MHGGRAFFGDGVVARGAALLCAVVLGACSGGETANTTPRSESDAEAADTMSGSGSECVEVARQPIALDEQSPLGFKPAEALESLAQPQAAPLRWAPEDVGVSFGPEAGDDTITLSVTPTANRPAPSSGSSTSRQINPIAPRRCVPVRCKPPLPFAS